MPAEGRIYSYERVWHPVHSALRDQGPYVVVLVTLPQADDVRIIGNLLGDPTAEVPIGAPVTGVFEHHPDAAPPYTLLHWRLR
ncbi:MAG: OB-fold domain-containing protein [Pseudomonadales bacterium]